MIKNNKKLSYILAALILVIVIVAGRSVVTNGGDTQSSNRTKENSASVFLNDEEIKFSKNPVLEEKTVYVPIDEFAKIIGATINFKGSEKIIMKKGDKNLVINLKDHTVITEGNETFFINSMNKGKKTLLPIDIISKHFGFNVADLNENAIKIYSDKNNIQNVEGESEDKEEVVSEEVKDEDKENVEVAEAPIEETPPAPEEDPNKKVAYLTFDDGPNPNTPQILDILKENDVKATFFMLGNSIVAHGDLAKRVFEEGHAVGVHSMTHNKGSVYASPDSFIHEMTITNDALLEATGRQTLLLRPPYGSKPYMKDDIRDMATSWGYRIWDWNVDSKDSLRKNTTADEVYNEVVNQVPGKNQAVLLFHDKEHTAQALPRIIEFLKASGYEIKKLDVEMTPLNFWNDIR